MDEGPESDPTAQGEQPRGARAWLKRLWSAEYVPPPRYRSRLLTGLSVLIPALFAWIFYVTLSQEVARRVLTLRCLENYAFAGYNQLLYNFSQTGSFFQTIHRGYDDNWMWTGHKAGLLPLVGLLYGLRPSPVWLGQLLVGGVALGAFPAWALGRHTVGGAIPGLAGALLGGFAGLALYFGSPPVYYMALQDYQDTAFAIPALVAAVYFSRRGSWVGFGLAALLACLVREEIAMMMTLVGFAVPGGLRRRLRVGLFGAAIGLSYLGVVWLVWGSQMHFEAPAQTQLRHIFSTFPPDLPTLTYDKGEAARFYLGLILPAQWLSLLSPLTLLPGYSALFVHMLVNPGNAVERIWGPGYHIHHLAPIVPLIIAASLESLGWLMAQLRRRAGRLGGGLALGMGVGVILLAGLGTPGRIANLGLQPGLSLGARVVTPHPLWALARKIPPGASAATDQQASLTIAMRARAYTYDESFQDKLRGSDPFQAVDYMLISERHEDWLARALAQSGAEVVGEAAGYTLVKLR